MRCGASLFRAAILISIGPIWRAKSTCCCSVRSCAGKISTLAKYEVDTYADAATPREPINDTVECLFIGGGFSALLTSARLREVGVESIRIVERGADVAPDLDQEVSRSR